MGQALVNNVVYHVVRLNRVAGGILNVDTTHRRTGGVYIGIVPSAVNSIVRNEVSVAVGRVPFGGEQNRGCATVPELIPAHEIQPAFAFDAVGSLVVVGPPGMRE